MECSIALVVDLANSHDPGTEENDHLPDIAALNEFLAAHKIHPPRAPTQKDLEEVWNLSATLRQVFEAPDEAVASRILNEVLAESGARPQLTDHEDGPWHLHYSPPGTPLAPRLAAESAMALALALAAGGFERLRVCEADDCADVFVDESRNRSRMYCSPQVCGNRASVAAYRARKRAAVRAN